MIQIVAGVLIAAALMGLYPVGVGTIFMYYVGAVCVSVCITMAVHGTMASLGLDEAIKRASK